MGVTLIQKITAAVTRLVTFVFTGSILLVTEPVFPSALAPLPRSTVFKPLYRSQPTILQLSVPAVLLNYMS